MNTLVPLCAKNSALAELRPGSVSDDAVGLEIVASLELFDRTLGLFTHSAIDGTGVKTGAHESFLDVSDTDARHMDQRGTTARGGRRTSRKRLLLAVELALKILNLLVFRMDFGLERLYLCGQIRLGGFTRTSCRATAHENGTNKDGDEKF
jgi:hypothetical protein